MAGDYSRHSFDPAKRFSLIRMQQGRMFTDADWNEQGDILRASDRKTATDIIGHAGFPTDDPGFGLSFDAPTGALVIGAGTGHVAGVRHVADQPSPVQVAKISGNGANAVWRIDAGGVLGDGDILEKPDGTRFRMRDFDQDEDGVRTFRTTPALTTNDGKLTHLTTVTRQPFAPEAELPDQAGEYLAYLKSTDQAVTALDDPAIREVALDGPDTATRDRTIWQVGLISFDTLKARGFDDPDLTCPALQSPFDIVRHKTPQGRLKARAELADIAAGPCTLPPSAGYRSLDNLLYRVEIHNGGDATAATYKWSRENAIHRTRYRSMDAGVLIVDSTGRDDLTALKTGDWIEIRDEAALLTEAPGFFARIDEVIGKRVSLAEIRDPDTLLPLTDAGNPDTDKLPPAAFVTRWEGGMPKKIADLAGEWGDLENGVQVGFEDGAFQSADHWTIPARAVSGDIDWPRHEVTGEPLTRAPLGPRRDYAALALLTRDGAGVWTITHDCRALFPPATEAKEMLHAGGDGQEAMPDPLSPNTRIPLAKPLAVAVTRGHAAVQGERIRFEVTGGDGRLGNGTKIEVAVTGADGIATVNWSLDATNFSQRVTARRLDAADGITHAPLHFNASLSRADATSYNPANTPSLAGANTVQKAIEALAGMQQIGCSTYVITPEQDWVAILENLKPRENASICFARGTYTTDRPVRMTSYGHISIHGAGAGTVEIVVDRAEQALVIEDCASVSVSGLSISAPAVASAIEPANAINRGGALDIGRCGEVEVHGCAISCGGGTSAERCCLVVRGRTRKFRDLVPTKSVKIRDNHFLTGHMQEAVLVTDAIDTDIEGNSLDVRRKSGSLGIERFVKDKAWVRRMAESLVKNPVKGRGRSKEGIVEIAAKEWRMGFSSPVTQDAWDEMVRENPPTAAQLRDEAGFKAYADKLIDRAVQDTSRLPRFKKQIDRLRESLGDGGNRLDNPKVLRTLLVTSEPEIYRFDARKGEKRNVLLEANGQVIAFNSPINQRDWSSALTRIEAARKIANADHLLSVAHAMASRFVTDKAFRAGLSSAEAWFASLIDDSPSLAWQGIVCGGQVLRNVRVHGNRIRDCQTGIRVAVSHRFQPVHVAGSITIEDNRLELMAPHVEAYAGYGILVGNSETVRILGNDLSLSSRPNFKNFYAQGIRIWGFLGRHIMVSQNRIAMATMGIRLNQLRPLDDNFVPLWVFSQNLVEGPKGTIFHKASPNWVKLDNNHTLPI